MKNKKFLIISCIVIFLIIIVGIVVAQYLINDSKQENKKNEEIEEIVTELFENSYKYYYYMYGDIKISDGYIVIEDETYYYVDEPLMTVNEFKKLVEDTFVSNMKYNLLEVEEKNEYINIADKIYVKKVENPCKNIHVYEFNDMKYEGDSEKKYVYHDQTRNPIYKENDTWKLGESIYSCDEY